MTRTRDSHASLSRSDLIQHSIDLILEHQAPSGAYPASPNYPTYQYGWLRDGAFIAHAMDLVGHHDSAHRFHKWAAETILRRKAKVDRLESLDIDKTRPLPNQDALHTRYTLDGAEVDGEWGSFQLDGYGFWLSSLAHHPTTHDSGSEDLLDAAKTVIRYLNLTWDMPCYDCWEEYPTRRHSTTWASIAGGLLNVADAFDHRTAGDIGQVITDRLRNAADNDIIRKFVDSRSQPAEDTRESSDPSAIAGHERTGKPLSPEAVDASILLTLDEFGPFPADDPLITATLKEVDSELVTDGGVHRYRDDEFYGGGQWPVLAGAYTSISQVDQTSRQRAIQWIEAQADENGNLPEQSPTHLRKPDYLEPWVDRWGPVAKPLLWSHAMYLIAVSSGNQFTNVEKNL
jgi:isomaltose glucohydrolase